MSELAIFTDGSVNGQTKVGYGACLLVTDLAMALTAFRPHIKIQYFAPTSSTTLELQTLLWAFAQARAFVADRADPAPRCWKVYTDCQNIINLPGRRARLEGRDYLASNNKLLNNADLYREFFRVYEALNCELIKVSGHQPAGGKNKIHQIFGLVDQAARQALRGACEKGSRGKSISDNSLG